MSNLAFLITELANTISALIDADAKNTAATATATDALIASKDAIIADLQKQATASETEIANADSALADLLVKAKNAVSAATVTTNPVSDLSPEEVASSVFGGTIATTVTASSLPVSDTLVEPVAEAPATAG